MDNYDEAWFQILIVSMFVDDTYIEKKLPKFVKWHQKEGYKYTFKFHWLNKKENMVHLRIFLKNRKTQLLKRQINF